MANKNSAKEWIVKAYHDLSAAQILFKANHYTDTIGSALQQSIEKTLKSFLAYENRQIIKTHELVEIAKLIEQYLHFNDSEIRFLIMATSYYTKERYPIPHRSLPSNEEIKIILDFAQKLLSDACKIYGLGFDELK